MVSFSCLFVQFVFIFSGFCQVDSYHERLFFLSDVQTPLASETIFLKPFRNKEGRDSLFADIVRQNPKTLLLLGDLTSMGSNEQAWTPLDGFLHPLHALNTDIYAIPGNHEYMATASTGIKHFTKRFPEQWLHGYCVQTDSLAIVLLNSNFNTLKKNELSQQLLWYKTTMDSLDHDPAIRAIIVCTHHAPYSNSKTVGCSRDVIEEVVPQFEKSGKAKLFISGHSHNLEYFSKGKGKYYLVIGGGGGIAQPLKDGNKTGYHDLIDQEKKPVYFYVIVERKGSGLKLSARGLNKDFKFFTLDFGEIPLN
jgi:predicted MPP superfamily phosphohydrolase